MATAKMQVGGQRELMGCRGVGSVRVREGIATAKMQVG